MAGNITFVGELFVKGMVSVRVVNYVIDLLLHVRLHSLSSIFLHMHTYSHTHILNFQMNTGKLPEPEDLDQICKFIPAVGFVRHSLWLTFYFFSILLFFIAFLSLFLSLPHKY